jgi:hypothetical protein
MRFALLLIAAAAAPLSAQQPVHHGRARELSVTPPRLVAEAVIDGVLDEPVWAQAALLTGFTQYRPVDGRPAEDSTEVLIWYAPDAMYFGIRAYEPHGTVRATLSDRDKVDNDDYVQLLLDTFDDRRRAYVIGVNPLGVQADGIRTEGSGGAAGGRGAGGRFENVDMNPDLIYASKGRVTPWGYEIEIRLPFKSVSYQAADPQRWAVNVIRKIQHSGYEDSWVPAQRASASFLSQSGTLEQLTDLHRGLLLELNPFTTGRLDGARDSTGSWSYDATPEVGFNLSWGITNTLALDGTVNPDFSQVEADVAQVTVNERFAVFFPEKRPFFLEGIEQFNTPNSLIYTRRLAQPVAGVKLTGKVGRTNIAVLSAVDDQDFSVTGNDYPVVNAARVRTDIGSASAIGFTYTDRLEGGAAVDQTGAPATRYNRVGSLDAHIVHGRMYFLEAQIAGSWTGGGGSSRVAPLWELTWDRTGRNWGFHYTLQGIHPEFEADVGFVPRTDVANARFTNRLTAYGDSGAALENWTQFITASGTWPYFEADDFEAPLEAAVDWRNTFQFRGGWEIQLSPQWASVEFDTTFYADYAVDTGADTVAFTVPGRENGLWALELGVETPQFTSLAASASVGVGRTAAFFEPAPARAFEARASVEWRPTDHLRVNAQYSYLALNRVRDDSRLSTAHIPRLRVEYQLARSIFLRFIGQYDAQERDALRDPATDRPILLADGSGGYAAAAAQANNNLRLDWLFSFHPNPGTVAYLGYGAGLTEDDAFAFRNVRRVSDGFFLKLSYLFRV